MGRARLSSSSQVQGDYWVVEDAECRSAQGLGCVIGHERTEQALARSHVELQSASVSRAPATTITQHAAPSRPAPAKPLEGRPVSRRPARAGLGDAEDEHGDGDERWARHHPEHEAKVVVRRLHQRDGEQGTGEGDHGPSD
jgi:hypothetical protein